MSLLNGRTNKFGWLQAPATDLKLLHQSLEADFGNSAVVVPRHHYQLKAAASTPPYDFTWIPNQLSRPRISRILSISAESLAFPLPGSSSAEVSSGSGPCSSEVRKRFASMPCCFV